MARFIIFLLLGMVSWQFASAQTSGHSPSGQITVELTPTEHYLKKEKEFSIDDVSHVKYDVVFKDRQGDELAKATYADVYGWDSLATPLAPEKIIALIDWSPEEDFAILPEEGWAYYQGPFPTAVNLRRDKNWETEAIISIDGWLSPTRFYAGSMLDCDFSVILFDAVTGESTYVRRNNDQIGYVLVENDSLGHVVIKSELNNCAYIETRDSFIPQCERWDLNSMEHEEIACPSK